MVIEQPVVGDDNTYNYNNDTDRDNFYTDCCKPSTKNIRKPRQFSIGGTDKTNYIPGYIRISYVDGTGGPGYSYQFLVLVRSGWNQSFVLFQRYLIGINKIIYYYSIYSIVQKSLAKSFVNIYSYGILNKPLYPTFSPQEFINIKNLLSLLLSLYPINNIQ